MFIEFRELLFYGILQPVANQQAEINHSIKHLFLIFVHCTSLPIILSLCYYSQPGICYSLLQGLGKSCREELQILQGLGKSCRGELQILQGLDKSFRRTPDSSRTW